jgi:tRNA-2-methylthio-N6-dimethylallyladenosine synthase
MALLHQRTQRRNKVMKYHIIVFGCQMNRSDAERLAAVLENEGYKKTQNINEANLIAIVMCSVRKPAVDRVHFLAHKFKKLKAKTILTGCILKKDKKLFEKNFDYVLDIKEACRKEDYLKITPKYSSKIEAYVPIMTGCNNFCSYCVVPYTRGKEISRSAKEIILEVKNLIKQGQKKIWLLGQNVNSYKDPSTGSGQAINFSKLLKTVNDIPGDFILNFTTSHPKDFSDELIETMTKCEKLSMDLNLPIQSGDDEILKKMNRPYTVAQYKNLVKKIRQAIPNIRLSTDIIVGFPGETKKQFNNTIKTLKEIGYGVAFINKYSPRDGTTAAKMEDNVPWEEKKRREKILINLINEKHKK